MVSLCCSRSKSAANPPLTCRPPPASAARGRQAHSGGRAAKDQRPLVWWIRNSFQNTSAVIAPPGRQAPVSGHGAGLVGRSGGGAVGTGLAASPPRADPGVRLSRTGLLSRVIPLRRSGFGRPMQWRNGTAPEANLCFSTLASIGTTGASPDRKGHLERRLTSSAANSKANTKPGSGPPLGSEPLPIAIVGLAVVAGLEVIVLVKRRRASAYPFSIGSAFRAPSCTILRN